MGVNISHIMVVLYHLKYSFTSVMVVGHLMSIITWLFLGYVLKYSHVIIYMSVRIPLGPKTLHFPTSGRCLVSKKFYYCKF